MVIKNAIEELKKSIVNQDELVETLIITLLAQGHILIEGLPGIAKTTAIKNLSKLFAMKFSRVQFTPDLLPSDIIGAEIYSMKDGSFFIKKGPIFSDLLLADEINRSPAKVQSALLEAMQERQVTIGDHSYDLKWPFLVMATMNPIEQEGVYSLPEAQLDRFLMKVIVHYPKKVKEEVDILNVFDQQMEFKKFNLQELKHTIDKIEKVRIEDAIKQYIATIIVKTREHPDIEIGASPRGSIALLKVAKVVAYLHDRDYVMPSDVIEYIKPVLRHRLKLKFQAQSEGKTEDSIIDETVKSVKL